MSIEIPYSPIRTIIIDDEDICRTDLKIKLKAFADIEIIGEADCAEGARELFHNSEPDLILLDIDMPGEDGFKFLESLPASPHVIFISSHQECAIKAFSVKALDFLEKPVNEDRLKQSIKRIKQEIKRDFTEDLTITGSSKSFIEECAQFFFKDGNDCWFVKFDDLRMIESDKNYCKLYFNKERRLIRRSISQMQEKLPQNKFFRANRQCLINFSYVKKLHTQNAQIISIEMKDGSRITMSRRATQKLKMIMAL